MDKALEHFDDFYKSIFRSKWPSVRVALLSPHKYVAVLNNFGDIEDTVLKLESLGAINLRNYFELTKTKMKESSYELKREKLLKKVFKLSEELDSRSQMIEKKAYGQIYSEKQELDVKEKLKDEECDEKVELSMSVPLHQSLNQAELDLQRVIDPSNVVDASTLFEFVPATKLMGMEDYVAESQHYSYYKVF